MAESRLSAVGGVLCAGFGTRMAPITDVIPKPLIPFMNTPLLAYALDHLQRAGVEHVGLNLHHLADAIPPIADRLGAAMGVRPVYAREWEILGTAGGARGIWKALGEPEETMILLNGDSIMNIDLREHLQAHKESGAKATLVVRPKDPSQPGKVWVEKEERKLGGLRDFRTPGEKGAALEEFDFTGVYMLEPELLREIALEPGCMIGDILGPRLAEGEEFGISINADFWAALDNPGLYFETMSRVLQEPGLFAQLPLPEPVGENLYLFSQEGIDDKAQLAGPILAGAHVQVAGGAYLGPRAVVDGVQLKNGASVREAVLYGMGAVEGEWHRCLAVAGKVVSFPAKEEG